MNSFYGKKEKWEKGNISMYLLQLHHETWNLDDLSKLIQVSGRAKA